MIKGISTAAKAMKNQVLRNDVIANNLANANTTGFKKEVTVFQRMKSGDGGVETVARAAASYEKGPFIRTGRPLDMAVQGDGFFVLETDEGERYTRQGSFIKDTDGYLATAEGHRVASSSGSLQLPPGDVTVSRDGLIAVNDEAIGRVRLVRFEDRSDLEKTGAAMFRAPEGAGREDVPEEETAVLSGFLEESNVEVVREMAEMIKALKAYEITQKALKSQDEILHLLTGTVGKTSIG
jgi:flagellar basal-body rod protein FlgF